jgi:hypothetical protein
MTGIGLAKKAGGGEIGRAGPHLDRIGAASEANDELIVRNFRPGTAKGDLLEPAQRTAQHYSENTAERAQKCKPTPFRTP